jgi:hypothetical protein
MVNARLPTGDLGAGNRDLTSFRPFAGRGRSRSAAKASGEGPGSGAHQHYGLSGREVALEFRRAYQFNGLPTREAVSLANAVPRPSPGLALTMLASPARIRPRPAKERGEVRKKRRFAHRNGAVFVETQAVIIIELRKKIRWPAPQYTPAKFSPTN